MKYERTVTHYTLEMVAAGKPVPRPEGEGWHELDLFPRYDRFAARWVYRWVRGVAQ
jgi:hypothetical protein